MNDKELADRFEQVLGFNPVDMFGDDWDTDWRVAGALMEKVDSIYPEKLVDEQWQVQASMDAMPTEWIVNESLPRAIIEACCEALDE